MANTSNFRTGYLCGIGDTMKQIPATKENIEALNYANNRVKCLTSKEKLDLATQAGFFFKDSTASLLFDCPDVSTAINEFLRRYFFNEWGLK